MSETTEGKTGRKQIGVQMDIDLWWKFKEQAIKERKSAGILLEQLVKDYLEKAKERERTT